MQVDTKKALIQEIASFIANAALTPRRLDEAGRLDQDEQRDQLMLRLARWQSAHVAPYRNLIENVGIDWSSIRAPEQLPAMTTETFRYTRVAAHPETEDLARFLTSGTTSGLRGMHAFQTLQLYDVAALRSAHAFLLADPKPTRLISLVPSFETASDSSLAYMVKLFDKATGSSCTYCIEGGTVTPVLWRESLHRAVQSGQSVLIVATAFAAVEALQKCDEKVVLPKGSRLMLTGGFKGKRAEIDADSLTIMLSEHLGLPVRSIIGEYGMTELSSQMYEPWLRNTSDQLRNVFEVPPWMLCRAVDPDTLQPLAIGKKGLLRIEDLANIDSCWAIQTSDLARCIDEQHIQLLGRAPGAVARGCSLRTEEALTANELGATQSAQP